MTVARSARRATVGALVVLSTLAATGVAGAATPITGLGVGLSTSASCTYGDVEVEYAATGVERQNVAFTAAGGSTLDAFESAAYLPGHVGTEYILTETTAPPPAGTAVAVHVTIGTTPPQADTTAEFFVLYRCDTTGNDAGGVNEVLWTCVGDYGTCPTTADEGLALLAATTPNPDTTTGPPPGGSPLGAAQAPSASPAAAVTATPAFTG